MPRGAYKVVQPLACASTGDVRLGPLDDRLGQATSTPAPPDPWKTQDGTRPGSPPVGACPERTAERLVVRGGFLEGRAVDEARYAVLERHIDTLLCAQRVDPSWRR